MKFAYQRLRGFLFGVLTVVGFMSLGYAVRTAEDRWSILELRRERSGSAQFDLPSLIVRRLPARKRAIINKKREGLKPDGN
jgi:hypothetical protein